MRIGYHAVSDDLRLLKRLTKSSLPRLSLTSFGFPLGGQPARFLFLECYCFNMFRHPVAHCSPT